MPRRLNELHFAQLLVVWQADGVSTVYEDIYHLPPAHAMTVTPSKRDIQRYWYLEHTPELQLESDEAYVEQFLEIYTEAVRCRLRSHRPVGVTLSGGLDSGSVAALAARELGKVGKRLPAFSSVPIYDVSQTTSASQFGDETPFVNATAQYAGNIDVHYIRAENMSPIAGMQRMQELSLFPVIGAPNNYWLIALMETAQQQGIGTLLTYWSRGQCHRFLGLVY